MQYTNAAGAEQLGLFEMHCIGWQKVWRVGVLWGCARTTM
jgi:hypothetical protein